MTKMLVHMVLGAVIQTAIIAGPIGDLGASGTLETMRDTAETVPPLTITGLGRLDFYSFLALGGEKWLLETRAAALNSEWWQSLANVAPSPEQTNFNALSDTTVPEPKSVTLLGVGLAVLALLGVRRRRRTHANNL